MTPAQLLKRLAVPLVLVLLGNTGAAQDSAPPHHAYLQTAVGLSGKDVREFESGRVVVSSLSGRDGKELVLFGAVRLNAPPLDVVEHLSRLDGPGRGPGVVAAGVIGTPPEAGQFDALVLDARDIADLSNCSPGRCPLQLPAPDMARFRSGVAWRSPAEQDTANRVARAVALDAVLSYLEDGHEGLSPYDDRRPASQPGDEYRRMLADPQYLPGAFAALRAYLSGYPKARLPGIRDRFFWATIDAGMKPTLRVSHMVVAPASALDLSPLNLAGVVVTTQLFATHYFSSALEWNIVAEDPSGEDSSYLFYLSRSWAHGLSGLRGRIARPIVRGRGRDATKQYLTFVQSAVEGL